MLHFKMIFSLRVRINLNLLNHSFYQFANPHPLLPVQDDFKNCNWTINVLNNFTEFRIVRGKRNLKTAGDVVQKIKNYNNYSAMEFKSFPLPPLLLLTQAWLYLPTMYYL